MGIRTWLGLKKKRSELERPSFWHEHSFSQLQQDRWVVHETGGLRDGFFLEIGAFDGKHLSNTYLLESEYGWRGILAEPNPIMHDKIQSIRTAALCTQPVDATSGKSVTMRFVAEQPEFSAMADHAFKDTHAETRRGESVEIVQTTISLNDLLVSYQAPGEIDFISIDTEGNETDILSTFDFSQFSVRLFGIEHNNTEANQKLDDLLLPNGYERVFREWSRWDAWYRKV